MRRAPRAELGSVRPARGLNTGRRGHQLLRLRVSQMLAGVGLHLIDERTHRAAGVACVPRADARAADARAADSGAAGEYW